MQNFIYLILLLLPTYLLRFEILGIPFTVLEVLILVLFLAFLIQTRGKFELDGYKIILALFLLAGLIGAIVSPDLRSALGLFKAYIVEPMLFFIVFINVKPDFDKVVKALSVGGLFIALVAIMQYFTGYGIPAPWNVRGTEFRVTSVYEYPNAVGLFLSPIIILALGCILKIKHKSFLLASVVLLGIVAILFAKTQGAMIAILGAVFFLGFFSKRYKYIFGLALILGIILALLVPGVREIILLQDTSGEVRLALWEGTWNLLKNNPITGAGLAGFSEMYAEYKLDRHVELLLYPHQILLNFWVELGLLGLIWLLWVVGKFFKQGFKNISRKKVVLMAVMVGVLIYGLVDVPYFKNDLAIMFWLWLGLMESRRK